MDAQRRPRLAPATPPSRVRSDSVALAGLLARESSSGAAFPRFAAQWPDAPSSSLTAAGPPRNHTGFPVRTWLWGQVTSAYVLSALTSGRGELRVWAILCQALALRDAHAWRRHINRARNPRTRIFALAVLAFHSSPAKAAKTLARQPRKCGTRLSRHRHPLRPAVHRAVRR